MSSAARHPRRIALVGAGFEPGVNAVGDHLRRLAAALERRGIECMLLGLNDPRVTEIVRSVQACEGRSLKVVRIPAKLSFRDKYDVASATLVEFQPDWVSMVMITYSFNPKGILTMELYWMPRLFATHRLHIQLHELWIGEGIVPSFKHAVVGAVQRWALLHLLRRLSADVLHTHIPLYQKLLKRYGMAAGILPLAFGNIPVVEGTADRWLFPLVARHGGPDLATGRRSYWIIGLFGSIGERWPQQAADDIVRRIGAIARRAGRRVVIASVGRAGQHGEHCFEHWGRHFPEMSFVMIGPRSEAEVSEFLNTMDFGLTSYPVVALGKSSSASSMLEHGVPVILSSWGDVDPENSSVSQPLQDLVWKNDGMLEERMLQASPRSHRKNGIERVVDQMLSDFEKADPLRGPEICA